MAPRPGPMALTGAPFTRTSCFSSCQSRATPNSCLESLSRMGMKQLDKDGVGGPGTINNGQFVPSDDFALIFSFVRPKKPSALSQGGWTESPNPNMDRNSTLVTLGSGELAIYFAPINFYQAWPAALGLRTGLGSL